MPLHKDGPPVPAKRSDKARMQLTVHGVVAGGGLEAEAAPLGETLWLGSRAGATGEPLCAGEVAL